jgi:hypothetical protein
VAAASPLRAQDCGGGIWPALRGVLLPEPIERMLRLRCLIRETAWNDSTGLQPAPGDTTCAGCDALRLRHLRRVDWIFTSALTMCEGDPEQALLVAALATLPFKRFPAVLPIVRLSMTVPVSTESDDDFRRRMRGLPCRLFADSPPGGDRDKLPHFFGSAWLYLQNKSETLSNNAGVLVELLEQTFKLQGARDERDLAANRLGVQFARSMLNRRGVPPSRVFCSHRPHP